MSIASPSESMKRNYKLCLGGNFVSILLMFGSAILMWFVSRRFGISGFGDAEPSFLTSSYIAATQVSLIVGLPAFVIAFIGMLRFHSWARSLFAFLMLAWGMQVFVFGFFNLPLTWGWAELFADLALLTGGAVLAMAYLSPIADLYKQTSRVVPSPEDANAFPASPNRI